MNPLKNPHTEAPSNSRKSKKELPFSIRRLERHS